MSDDLPPLPMRRQIANARFRIKMCKDTLEADMRDVERIKLHLITGLDSVTRAFKFYVEAVDELEQLTNKRKPK